MKKHLNQTIQFVKNNRVPIVIGATIGVGIVIRRHTNEIAQLQADLRGSNDVLTMIWETYLPDPELVNNAAVCTITSHH